MLVLIDVLVVVDVELEVVVEEVEVDSVVEVLELVVVELVEVL